MGNHEVEVRRGRVRVVDDAESNWLEIGPEPMVVGRNAACDLVLDDGKVSAVHAELLATEQGVRLRDLGSRNGTFAGGMRTSEVYLLSPTRLRIGETEIAFEPLSPEHITLGHTPSFGPLFAHSAAMQAIFVRLAKVAPTDLTLLITGETGTGKELVAKATHEVSSRSKRPFVVVDCGSIPPTLAEATLFGHERGAFTGAFERRLSPFQEADGGTIFLDELGELPIDVQPKLLRAIAERRIKPVGGTTYRDVDVRIIAATRRDLVRAVNTGSFRSDLYFRIAQITVALPPLRQRLSDIPVLVRQMLADMGDEGAFERVTNTTLERLMRHDWPGNVRELRNAVAVAHALADEGDEVDIAGHLGSLKESTLGPAPLGNANHAFQGQRFQDAKRDVLTRFERDYFAALCDEAKGNVSEMARRSGMERAHVRTYLRRHGITARTDGGESPE